MSFAEKLSFLMRITGTNNKTLANELSVDPSMISLMRTGKRKVTRNPERIQKMALFFARNSSAVFQRQALSDMLGFPSISPDMPIAELADYLVKWLQGEIDMASTVLSDFHTLSGQAEQISAPLTVPVPDTTDKTPTQFFYGDEGRREVMTLVMQKLQSISIPCSVMLTVDDNLEWLLSNYALTRKFQSQFLDLIRRGFTFQQIMPPLNYINRYTDSLQFWLPIYATGSMKVYYYPRLRGNLYRHSLVVIPGHSVMYCSTLGIGSANDITMYSTDPKLVTAFQKQFQEHLFMCRPALNVYQDNKTLFDCCEKYLTLPGNSVQMVNSLSLNSMSGALLKALSDRTSLPDIKYFFQRYYDFLPEFQARLREDTFIDMCYMPTIEEIRSGRVPIVTDSFPANENLFYTPEAFCLHLKNILSLMEQYENYYFVPLHNKQRPNYNLFVNEGGIALANRITEPVIALEILRPAMITAFQEHLLRKADAVGYDKINREKSRMELRGLIQELSN